MPSNRPRPSWWIGLSRPCITAGAWSIAPPVTWASAWWPRHTPSTGTSARCSTSSETPTSRPRSGAAGAGGDDDVVDRQRRQLLPRQLVVADDDRLVATGLAQQVEEVEGERVVVVDQERAHGRIYTLATLAQERLRLLSRGDFSLSGCAVVDGAARAAPILETVVTTINPDASVNCAAMGVEWGERADRHQALSWDADAPEPARHRGRRRQLDRRHPALQPGRAGRSPSADPSGGRRRGCGAGRCLLVARGARGGDRRRRTPRPRHHVRRRRRDRARVPRVSTERATRSSRPRSSPPARACCRRRTFAPS